MPTYGSPRNPVDVTAEVVNRAGVAEPLALLTTSPQVDSVVVVSSLAGPHMLEREEAGIRRVLDAATNRSSSIRIPNRVRPAWPRWLDGPGLVSEPVARPGP